MPSRVLSFSTSSRRPGRRALRIVGIVLAVLAGIALVWGMVLGSLWGYAWLRLGPDDVRVVGPEGRPLGGGEAAGPPDATTFLVTLTGPVDPTIPRPPALVGPVTLVQTGGPREHPAVLSVPPELRVTVEGVGDLPLAEVQSTGGPELLVPAIVDYSGVRIDHVVSLSIDALPLLVDALEPLEVCGHGGCAPTTGAELRDELALADDERLPERVADVTRAIGARFDTAFVTTSPIATWRVIGIVADEVLTDVSLRGRRLLDVAEALAATTRLDTDRIPLIVDPATGEAVPFAEPTMVRFQHLREGTPLRDAAAGEEVGDLEAEMVSGLEVAILNGAGIDGLAGRVQVELEAAGFTVVGTGNARGFGRSDTVITYVADDPPSAFAAGRLSEVLGGAALDPVTNRPGFEGAEVDLLVTVGEDQQR